MQVVDDRFFRVLIENLIFLQLNECSANSDSGGEEDEEEDMSDNSGSISSSNSSGGSSSSDSGDDSGDENATTGSSSESSVEDEDEDDVNSRNDVKKESDSLVRTSFFICFFVDCSCFYLFVC